MSDPFDPQVSSSADSAATAAVDPAVSEAAQSILDPLVSLLLSSPLSAGTTIILLTIVFRSAVTLPATLWQRRRMKRTKEIIRPAMKIINDRLAVQLAGESRRKGLSYDEYKKELKRQMAIEQSALHKQHGTHPLPTMLAPLIVHIPLLLTLSLTIRRTIEAPLSPWAAESFLWIDQLGVSDTIALPIVGAMLGMGTAELVGRRNSDVNAALADAGASTSGQGSTATTATAATPASPQSASSVSSTSLPATTPSASTKETGSARRLPSHLAPGVTTGIKPARRSLSTSAILDHPTPRPRPARKPAPSPPATSRVVGVKAELENLAPTAAESSSNSSKLRTSQLTSRILTNAMRCGAVLFAPIAAQVPAALALYWTASMGYTFVQNLVLDWMDAREKDAKSSVAGMPTKGA